MPRHRVVIVTRGDLFPTNHGGAVRVVAGARALSRRDAEVAVVTDAGRHWWHVVDGEIARRPYPAALRWTTPPVRLRRLLRRPRGLPAYNRFLYLPLSDRGFVDRARHAADCIDATVLQAVYPAYAHPCLDLRDELDVPVVLEEHNVEYQRIAEQAPVITAAQASRLREIEVGLARRCDAVICVSEPDRTALSAAGVDPARLHLIPHGVDLAAFAGTAADARDRYGIPEAAPLLAYHGIYRYPPNLEAVTILGDEILPRLEAAGHVAHVLAIGGDPPARSPHPRIHFTGSVEAVGPWLSAADLAVIPLVSGGGTRMKILDCFAARLPVVATAKGIEGIPVRPGREALVIDDWDAMAAAAAALLDDADAARGLGDSGRAFAESLDWGEIARSYEALYQSLST